MDKDADMSLIFMKLVEQPLVFLTSDYIIVDMNISAEKVFNVQKVSVVGKIFTFLCPTFDPKVVLANENNRIRKTLFLYVYITAQKKNSIVVYYVLK
jgi:two-component system, OmpR family, aerobic respiration control sensor histidine kinase ArcB